MNAFAFADEAPVYTLLRGTLCEPRVPRQRNADRATVHKVHHQRVGGYGDPLQLDTGTDVPRFARMNPFRAYGAGMEYEAMKL